MLYLLEIESVLHQHRKITVNYLSAIPSETAYVVYWPDFLVTDPEVRVQFPGATRFSAKQWFWNGVHVVS
jgi:hypothetical protein